MAKFKVGEKARYIGPTELGGTHGRECQIESIDRPGWSTGAFGFSRAQKLYPGQVIYGVVWLHDTKLGGHLPESELEKLLPKHQANDLKVAEPTFINGQLKRWLKQEEKVDACRTE
jgi:hypothetical protein